MDKKRIHEMLECLTKWALAELDKGKDAVDTKEMGEVIDMVKDLACAEKDVWEKCYYEKIVEAMKKEEENGGEKGMPELPWYVTPLRHLGYDRWRTSSGRFADKGTGHETSMAEATGRSGYSYRPELYYPDPRFGDMQPDWYSMGYSGNGSGRGGSNAGSGGSRSGSSGNSGSGGNSGSSGRMGYDGDTSNRKRNYDNARRFYTENPSIENKEEMDMKSEEYVAEAVETMKDIFAAADPTMQNKMKSDLFRLCREFGLQM